MKALSCLLAALVITMAVATPANAHFQMIIPSTDIVSASDSREISLKVMFTHPMEGQAMDMAKPAAFGVLVGGKKQDLLGALQPMEYKGHSAFRATYKINRPGDHIFYVEPTPYWEPGESIMIVHYTKVVVDALGLEEGWDKEVGLKTEIVPLVRPYGLWAGNIFSGMVKKDGKPMPYADVEVEYFNEDGKVKPPSDPFVTQVLKADGNGVFSYSMPRAGWWGFAALSEGDKKMKSPDGKEVPVELGALIWVRTIEMK